LDLPKRLTVYEIVSNKSKMSYIGVTAKPVDLRLREHMSCRPPGSARIAGDVEKFGRQSFFVTILCELPAIQALAMEKYIIERRRQSGCLYNGTRGGDGYALTSAEHQAIELELSELRVHGGRIPPKFIPPMSPAILMTKCTESQKRKKRNRRKLSALPYQDMAYL
jgi:hypothetical protein